MKYALVFPGQGSQSVGMLSDVYDNFTIVKDIFNQASDAIGIDLWKIAKEDQQALNNTQNTQPIMLTAGYAIYKIMADELDLSPHCMAGHSLGEYSALVAAKSISFVDAVKIVTKRAELMQSAVSIDAGAMAAIIGLDDDKIVSICKGFTNGIVEAVNFNSPGQVVIAGDKKLVKQACKKMQQEGARRVVFLPVSVPSHCSLMTDIAKDFQSFINSFEFCENNKVLHNVDADFASNVEDLKLKLVMQLYNPVLWTDTINNMAKIGVDRIIECGPGRVLAGLVRRIDKTIKTNTVFDVSSLNITIKEIK